MFATHTSRRAFLLRSVAFGGLLAVIGYARPAKAFISGSVLSKGPGLASVNSCSADAEHERIKARLEALLATQSGQSGTYLTEQATCPSCGCRITAVRYVQ